MSVCLSVGVCSLHLLPHALVSELGEGFRRIMVICCSLVAIVAPNFNLIHWIRR